MPTGEVVQFPLTKLHRSIYIRYRIPEIREELKRLIAERLELPKQVEDMEPDQRKITRRRRVYIHERVAILKDELYQLQSETRNSTIRG